MAKIKGAIVVDTERCKGCNLCVVACPLHVIALNAKQVNKKGYTRRHPYRSRRLLWLSHHSPIGNIGNAGRRETLGNYRYGGVTGRK